MMGRERPEPKCISDYISKIGAIRVSKHQQQATPTGQTKLTKKKSRKKRRTPIKLISPKLAAWHFPCSFCTKTLA